MEKATSVKKRVSRTVYRVDLNSFLKLMGNVVDGALVQGHPSAIGYVRKCVTAVKGADKRELSPTEASDLLKRSRS